MILDEKYRLWAAERDGDAKEELFAEVRRHVMRTAHDDDVCQSVCLTLLEKLESFSPVDEYAFTRYVSALTTTHRMKQAFQHKPEQWDESEETAADEEPFISISELTPFAQTVAASILAGHSLEETAAAMNLKAPTLRKKLQRARHEKPVSPDI